MIGAGPCISSINCISSTHCWMIIIFILASLLIPSFVKCEIHTSWDEESSLSGFYSHSFTSQLTHSYHYIPSCKDVDDGSSSSSSSSLFAYIPSLFSFDLELPVTPYKFKGLQNEYCVHACRISYTSSDLIRLQHMIQQKYIMHLTHRHSFQTTKIDYNNTFTSANNKHHSYETFAQVYSFRVIEDNVPIQHKKSRSQHHHHHFHRYQYIPVMSTLARNQSSHSSRQYQIGVPLGFIGFVPSSTSFTSFNPFGFPSIASFKPQAYIFNHHQFIIYFSQPSSSQPVFRIESIVVEPYSIAHQEKHFRSKKFKSSVLDKCGNGLNEPLNMQPLQFWKYGDHDDIAQTLTYTYDVIWKEVKQPLSSVGIDQSYNDNDERYKITSDSIDDPYMTDHMHIPYFHHNHVRDESINISCIQITMIIILLSTIMITYILYPAYHTSHLLSRYFIPLQHSQNNSKQQIDAHTYISICQPAQLNIRIIECSSTPSSVSSAHNASSAPSSSPSSPRFFLLGLHMIGTSIQLLFTIIILWCLCMYQKKIFVISFTIFYIPQLLQYGIWLYILCGIISGFFTSYIFNYFITTHSIVFTNQQQSSVSSPELPSSSSTSSISSNSSSRSFISVISYMYTSLTSMTLASVVNIVLVIIRTLSTRIRTIPHRIFSFWSQLMWMTQPLSWQQNAVYLSVLFPFVYLWFYVIFINSYLVYRSSLYVLSIKNVIRLMGLIKLHYVTCAVGCWFGHKVSPQQAQSRLVAQTSAKRSPFSNTVTFSQVTNATSNASVLLDSIDEGSACVGDNFQNDTQSNDVPKRSQSFPLNNSSLSTSLSSSAFHTGTNKKMDIHHRVLSHHQLNLMASQEMDTHYAHPVALSDTRTTTTTIRSSFSTSSLSSLSSSSPSVSSSAFPKPSTSLKPSLRSSASASSLSSSASSVVNSEVISPNVSALVNHKLFLHVIASTFICFLCLYHELYHLLSSIWLDIQYATIAYMYLFVLCKVTLLSFTSSSVIIYLHVLYSHIHYYGTKGQHINKASRNFVTHDNDSDWFWLSIRAGGSPIFAIYIYCWYFLLSHTPIQSILSCVMYIVYTTYFCIPLLIIALSISFLCFYMIKIRLNAAI